HGDTLTCALEAYKAKRQSYGRYIPNSYKMIKDWYISKRAEFQEVCWVQFLMVFSSILWRRFQPEEALKYINAIH
ncbi:hypothetical protein KKE68_04875, partial [Patescibacteria group bacterium]|nr:hypothetical protein [Patescibacteria group bacterium]